MNRFCFFILLSVLGFGGVAGAQSSAPLPDLPAAPAPSKPSFTLPPGTSTTVASPKTPPPPSPYEDVFCSAPSETGWRIHESLSAAQHREIQDYMSALLNRISSDWYQHIPRAARDPWNKGATLLVRFDVDHKGDLKSLSLMMSSGRSAYDARALDAISAATVAPLPVDVRGPLHVCVQFFYNQAGGPRFGDDPLEQKDRRVARP